jgi:hypothetical protein
MWAWHPSNFDQPCTTWNVLVWFWAAAIRCYETVGFGVFAVNGHIQTTLQVQQQSNAAKRHISGQLQRQVAIL